MKSNLDRRYLLKALLAAPTLAAMPLLTPKAFGQTTGLKRYKISLNAYSFNQLLESGKMNLNELLGFCAAHNFEAVDLTAYYFPNYPAVPPDEYLHEIKMKAFRLGLAISGTGVRNDFTYPDAGKRQESVSW